LSNIVEGQQPMLHLNMHNTQNQHSMQVKGGEWTRRSCFLTFW